MPSYPKSLFDQFLSALLFVIDERAKEDHNKNTTAIDRQWDQIEKLLSKIIQSEVKRQLEATQVKIIIEDQSNE